MLPQKLLVKWGRLLLHPMEHKQRQKTFDFLSVSFFFFYCILIDILVCDGCHGAHVHSSTGVSECVKTTDRNKVNQYDILFICQNKVLFRKSWPVWTEVCVKGYLKTLVPLCVFPAHRSRSLSCPVAQGCENLWQTYQRVSLIIVHLTHTHTNIYTLRRRLFIVCFIAFSSCR